MPNGMDDDAFNEEEQRINKAILDIERCSQKWQEFNSLMGAENAMSAIRSNKHLEERTDFIASQSVLATSMMVEML